MLPYRESRFVNIALLVFFLLVIAYGYYEGRAMLYGPQIRVPASTIVVSESFTMIRGQAEHIAELRMNGAVVAVTEDGMFEEPYLLTPGENRIVLDAVDQYGRSRQEIIEIIYTPATSTPPFETAVSTTTASSTPDTPAESE